MTLDRNAAFMIAPLDGRDGSVDDEPRSPFWAVYSDETVAVLAVQVVYEDLYGRVFELRAVHGVDNGLSAWVPVALGGRSCNGVRRRADLDAGAARPGRA